MRKMKTIIFDLSEVIISGYYGVEHIIERETGICANEFWQRTRDTVPLWLDAMRGNITEDQYIEQLFAGKNWKMSAEQFKAFFRANLNNTMDGTMQIVEKLKGKYKLVLLSDHLREMTDYILQTHRGLDAFDQIIWSYQIGQVKTDNGTFEKVLDMIGATADETLFIDDAQCNIDCAKAAGLDAILFTNATELEKQLLKRKLLNV